MNNSDCLVIVPIFNESENIANVISDLKQYFQNILVVDDGSNDKCSEIIKDLDVNCIRHAINLGQGAAIETGMRVLLQDKLFKYGLTYDGDGQNRAIDAYQMLNLAKDKNLHVVLGTRFTKKENIEDIPFFKRVALRLARQYERLFYFIELSDAHNGLRVINRDIIEKVILPIKNHDMSHATEISYKICKAKCTLQEYPVNVLYKNKRSQSPINAINIAISNIFNPI